jgi:hypothetical protein
VVYSYGNIWVLLYQEGTVKYVITDCGKVIKELSYFQFVDYYYDEFGTECGSPASVRDGLIENQMQYLGKGISVTAMADSGANPAYRKIEGYCSHSKKYIQKFTTFQFEYCPDCKKEV